ncbi:MAG: maltodextrin phosphorylase [Gammaproteobacteria bacterium SG8_11]|nr:MAG: maltodextrin phosphorylase [Gammaproteobacteria bacterium SG8_11]
MNTPTESAKQKVEQPEYEPTRTGLGLKTLKRALLDNLFYIQGRPPDVATPNDYYQALAYTVRDRLLHRWIKTAQAYKNDRSRTVCYLSAEYLLGPHLGNNLINLGIAKDVKQAVEDLGLNLDDLMEQEEEPGLGNGGLGRLAACFMDSLATLQIPAIGYGIRYEFGIFDQSVNDGWQVEHTDKWLHAGNPWELPRPKITFKVKLGGYTEHFIDDGGSHRVLWIPDREVKGVAYDTPIPGYRVNNANLLRLWSAEAPESFDFQAFNLGNYYQAVEQKVISENLTKVLYPNDEPEAGKQLRLQQQYFFVSCSLQDMLRIYIHTGDGLERFHEKYVIQLNDTHPSVAVAELMRLLIDEHHMDWDTAWSVTQKSFAYTNHTLLPEALEKWPVRMFQQTLPRHLEIIFEINHRFLSEVRNLFPEDEGLISRVSLIEENGERYVRMANLAAVGSCAINGVAELHSELLKNSVLADFYRIMPYKFSNKTNGVTPRRFMVLHNPGLSGLITDALGDDSWVRHLEEIKRLEDFADDGAFRDEWLKVKQLNKHRFTQFIQRETGVVVDPDTLFDIQVKRIHEYKRQHLNLLNIVTLYHHIKNDPNIDITPRTFIFGGKAAPSYYMAKLIIKLINSVADVINNDPDVKDRVKVVFVPNYNVKNSQYIFPAADLSEQISLAGKEASGTGNMKFSMNGALTIGTLDGANIEIQQEVGAENFFQFGLNAEEVTQLKAHGYHPREHYNNNTQLRAVMDLISTGLFSHSQINLFQPLIDGLLHQDQYMVLADYQSYVNAQARVGHAYRDIDQWARMSILNVARMGKFSSDRAIRQYCEEIWRVNPVPINL